MQKKEMSLCDKVVKSIAEEGICGCALRTKAFVKKKINERKTAQKTYKDILFITGCREELPHPWRYRVTHQREQLESCNMSTDEVYYRDLSINQLRYYRGFVFFRCPYTELIGKFVLLAKKLNKKLIYDIDDLVIDTKFTNTIPYVQKMRLEDKFEYDENVMNMQKLLLMCDFAVTTTNCLAEELRHYVSKVFVNRNTASEEMVLLSKEALSVKKDKISDKIRIGYFSGSITHNADIAMILPVLARVMEEYKHVELCFAGELDLPQELKKYRDRITLLPFSDWKKLPKMIASVDINLAPLEDTIFNCAKSENKWVEASLVKVVTVASDVGAFHDCIENGVTGVLCKTNEEWVEALERLIVDEIYRETIAEQAYRYCLEHCTTIRTGMNLTHYLEQNIPMNYGFILPGLEISGGMKVALKHASMLQEQEKEVVLFTLDNDTKWFEYEQRTFPVISIKNTRIEGNIGCAIATMWTTLPFVEQYANITRRCYLVQNYETEFYGEGDMLRVDANKTYMPHNHVEFLTISKWCQSWLKDKYYQEARYAPNGLEIERFECKERDFKSKIRILIEGDCAVEYKNVDEAFRIVERLDKNLFEIWYMSYNAEPKRWYKVDKFLHKVPYEKVPEVYSACDILLKTSLLESFSYPPLEMMATGGCVIAVLNGGNSEYLQDEMNCLLYSAGNIEKAIEQIERICQDEEMRKKLYFNGRKTAEARAWDLIKKEILMSLYLKNESC